MVNISDVKEEIMKPAYLVLAIYETRNTLADEEKFFEKIIINDTILDLIDTINFVYVKDGLEPSDEIKKVGYLMNIVVYLDPHRNTNNITFTNDEESYDLEVII